MKPETLKKFSTSFKEKMKDILKNNIYSEIVIYESLNEIKRGQFFLLSLDLHFEDFIHKTPLFYFQVKNKTNDFLDYNYFYSLNDDLFEEIYVCCKEGHFDSLIKFFKNIFKEIEKNDQSATLEIESYITSDSFLLQNRMEESLGIIEYEKGNIEFSCLMSERHKYKTIDEDGKEITVIVPFDMRDRFPSYTEKSVTMIRCFKTGCEGCPKSPSVAMNKVFIGMPFRAKYEDIYDFGILKVLAELELEPYRADKDINNIDIMCKICEQIQICPYAIVNISEWNPNVLFELGLLYGLGKKVIIIKDESTTSVPIDLSNIEYISYSNSTQLVSKLKEIFEHKFLLKKQE